MTKSARVRVRIEPDLKEHAEQFFHSLGIEEHEGLEGIAVFTSCIFIETPHKTKFFNP
jgi:hypothetical protein